MSTAPHPPRAGPMTPRGPTDPEQPLPVCSVCLEAMLQGDPVVISEHRPPPPPVHVRCWRLPPLPPLAPVDISEAPVPPLMRRRGADTAPARAARHPP
jgi:hypothetical protein